ncbi:MAG: hypothetical protein IPN34_04465 [Planctomycetes bacterium]|nr:hypothetical protein [Planctomycetota bacterium]
MSQSNPSSEDLEARLARASSAWSSPDEPSAAPADAPSRGLVLDFLAENWLWIVVPALLVIALLGGTAIALSMMSEGDSTTPFVYATYD